MEFPELNTNAALPDKDEFQDINIIYYLFRDGAYVEARAIQDIHNNRAIVERAPGFINWVQMPVTIEMNR